ncbi:MAG: response regulator transcription factor [Paracoccaceae bacterium]
MTAGRGARPDCTVLLVEDDTGIGRMLERGLAAEGYAVVWARDLKGATEAARRAPPDLVVLDRMLPDGDGADLCRALRRFGARAPVLMLTARETLDDKLEGFDAGADDYVTKPFELDELLARLAALARRRPDAPFEPVLDEADRALVAGGVRVRFTAREWPLLALLFAHEGETVSRAALLEAGWGAGSGVSANAVDVYVGYLRRKLDAVGPGLRIETVRGTGFVMRR